MPNPVARRLCLTGLLSLLALAPNAFAQQASSEQARTDVTTEQFNDWEVVCPSDSSQGNCTMNQVVTNADSDQPMMRVVVAYPPQLEGRPAMTFLLPLGVRLAPGLQLSAGSAQPAQFPYQVCLRQGCRADLPVEPSLLEALRSGSSATLSLVGPRGNRMDLDISLMGFTDASQRIAP
ncbi:invasion associated locus B family protein [Halomonas nitroreducens]|uniref:Invasion associated locus B family protein n=1 Tax=Halomonas nitroreducens TaxID=447425 RepID=A0A431V4K5_9GAMM|nr:invasion associated locus B family protein [Halomonas nitroreducens]RTR03861.1 invasion associated locus B family protein [Halomonas nitroreducens]